MGWWGGESGGGEGGSGREGRLELLLVWHLHDEGVKGLGVHGLVGEIFLLSYCSGEEWVLSVVILPVIVLRVFPLVHLALVVWCYSSGHLTCASPSSILYSTASLDVHLRYSSEGQFQDCNISPTLQVLLWWSGLFVLCNMQWGTVAVAIQFHCAENPELLKVLSLRPGVSQNIALHAPVTTRKILYPWFIQLHFPQSSANIMCR